MINLILQVTQDFRLSYGLGLALKLGGVARIELNYCVPVKVRSWLFQGHFFVSNLHRFYFRPPEETGQPLVCSLEWVSTSYEPFL